MNSVPFQESQPNSYRHELIRHESPVVREGGVFESGVVSARRQFNEALMSWNATTPPGAGFWVELRVGRQCDGYWTPYLHVGDWGPAPPRSSRLVACDVGRVDVDLFRSDQRFDRAQYRIQAASPDGRPVPLCIRRVTICLTETVEGSPASPSRSCPVRLPVPFRSQLAADSAIAPRICSPTSLAMVMQYRGIDLPTTTVAAACYDPAHDIYGNWPRNVQAAYSLGVPGYLTRFSDWDAVATMIAANQPLIASVRFSEPGALTGAPYSTTRGHLLVICGFNENGNVHVNDPAAPSPEQGCAVYHRLELDRVWLQATGVAYVLLPIPSAV